ncbi:MAG: hypothetical protein GAK43_02150 [Stenotrophomonas maltophilia]|nr:MAG: hypothetical protein GAK43_02150 [Stenotrophomonas maltophilia]
MPASLWYRTAALFGSLSIALALPAVQAEPVLRLPFHLDGASLPVLSLELGGARQVFHLDTSSLEALHLDRALLANIPGLTLSAEKRRSTDLTGKVYLDDRFRIARLDVDGLRFDNVDGVTLTPWGKTLSPDGHLPSTMAIGLGLFKDKALLIDYRQRQLSVAAQARPLIIGQTGWIDLPLQLTEEGVVLHMAQGAGRYDLILDTGASLSVLFKQAGARPFTPLAACQTLLAGLDFSGCQATTLHFAEPGLERLSLGAMVLDGDYGHLDMHGLLGSNFFEHFAVLLDFPGERLLIRPYPPAAPARVAQSPDR